MSATKIYAHMTPLELLSVQDAANNILMDPQSTIDQAQLALVRRDAVNLELVARGRCTICGLKHCVMECPRVIGFQELG